MAMNEHRYPGDVAVQKDARADANISSIGHRSDKLVAELVELNERVGRLSDFLDPRPGTGSVSKEPQAVQSGPLEWIGDALSNASRLVGHINNQIDAIEARVS